MRVRAFAWFSILGAALCVADGAAAQCPANGITVVAVTPPCSNLPALVPVFDPGACSVDLHYLPFVASWIPYRSWIALGVSSQTTVYPQLFVACPQPMNPIVILPLTGSRLRVPLPPGAVGLSFVASAVTLFHEPNTAGWFLVPGQQAMRIVVV